MKYQEVYRKVRIKKVREIITSLKDNRRVSVSNPANNDILTLEYNKESERVYILKDDSLLLIVAPSNIKNMSRINNWSVAGQGFLEYALLLVVVAVCVIILLAIFGSAIPDIFDAVLASL